MLKLVVAKGCSPTAEILRGLLEKEGALKPGTLLGYVCWGASTSATPSLNRNCSNGNKLNQLMWLRKAGITTVPFTQVPGNLPYPLVARRLQHHGGTDILYCKDGVRAKRALRLGRSYFTKFIPSRTEFRVWIYRNRHLGTYEKVLAHPEMKTRLVSRNHRNGYAFQLVPGEHLPQMAIELARKSVAALQLDFGAVDILLGKDNQFYVLEVNTAPGVEGEGRQAIQLLAHRMARWAVNGFPARGAQSVNET